MIVKNINFGIRSIYGLIKTKEFLVIREQDRVIAIDQKKNDIQWELVFEDDNMFGIKVIYLFNDLIYTVVGKGEKEQFLYAINQDGIVKWEKKIGWELTNNYGGLFFKDSRLLFHEIDADKKNIHANVVEASSGKAISRKKTPYDLLKSENSRFQTIAIHDNYIYEITKNKKLFKLDFQLNIQKDLFGLDGVHLLKVVDENLAILSCANRLYKLSLVRKEMTEVETLHFSTNEDISRFEPLYFSFDKILFLSKTSSKLWIYNFKTEKIEWEFKPDDDDFLIYDLLVQESNGLLILNSMFGFTLIQLNLETGEIIDEVFFEDETLRGYPFLHKNKVFFCSDSGLNELQGVF